MAAERAVYQKLVLHGQKEIENIIAAFQGKEQASSRFVKNLVFLLDQYETDVFENCLEPLAIMFPYVESLYFYPTLRGFYGPLVYVCLDNKWRFFEAIPMTEEEHNRISYVSCALACKARLTRLHLNNEVINKNFYSFFDKQYDRLELQLDRFPNLKELMIITYCGEVLQDFDSVIDKCTTELTELVYCVYYGEKPKNYNIATYPVINLTRIKKLSNITSIDATMCIDDENTLKYIMQKFDSLENLSVRTLVCNPTITVRNLNITLKSLLDFMGFLEGIENHIVELIVDKSLIFQLFDSANNKVKFEHLHINYWKNFLQDSTLSTNNSINSIENIIMLSIENSAASDNDIKSLGLNYNYTRQTRSHLGMLEKYGHILKYLKFEFANIVEINQVNTKKCVRGMMGGYFLDHILKHCVNLEHLHLKGLRPLFRCNPSTSKSHSINTLTLDYSTVANASKLFFYELSVRLVALKHINLSLIFRKESYFMIDVPYTNLDIFSLGLNWGSSRAEIGIKILTEDQVLFYAYHSCGNKFGVSKLNIGEYEDIYNKSDSYKNIDSGYPSFAFDMRCRSIKKFTFSFLRGTHKKSHTIDITQ